MSGEQVLAGVATGMEAAKKSEVFQCLIDEEGPSLLGFAKRLLGDPEEARDLTQDSLLQAFQALDSFRGECTLKHWVLRILIHEGIKRLRRRRLFGTVASWFGGQGHASSLSLPGFGMSGSASPEQQAGERERANHLLEALEDLPARQRAVVLLRFVEGHSVEEMASLLGCGTGSIKTHLVRALRRLRQLPDQEELGGVG